MSTNAAERRGSVSSPSEQSEEIKVWWEQCPRAASNPCILDIGPMFGVISAEAGTSVPLHSKLSFPQELERYMKLQWWWWSGRGGSFSATGQRFSLLDVWVLLYPLRRRSGPLRCINMSRFFSRWVNCYKQNYPESIICMLGVQRCRIMSWLLIMSTMLHVCSGRDELHTLQKMEKVPVAKAALVWLCREFARRIKPWSFSSSPHVVHLLLQGIFWERRSNTGRKPIRDTMGLLWCLFSLSGKTGNPSASSNLRWTITAH